MAARAKGHSNAHNTPSILRIRMLISISVESLEQPSAPNLLRTEANLNPFVVQECRGMQRTIRMRYIAGPGREVPRLTSYNFFCEKPLVNRIFLP
jgi:hypothetical protein